MASCNTPRHPGTAARRGSGGREQGPDSRSARDGLATPKTTSEYHKEEGEPEKVRAPRSRQTSCNEETSSSYVPNHVCQPAYASR